MKSIVSTLFVDYHILIQIVLGNVWLYTNYKRKTIKPTF